MIRQRISISDLERKYGGLRKAARALKIDPAYLRRLRDGKRTNPSELILKRLQLKHIVMVRFEDKK